MNGLKEKRKARKLSRRMLAEILGVSQSSINQYERGARDPNLAMLQKLAKYFNCSIDELL